MAVQARVQLAEVTLQRLGSSTLQLAEETMQQLGCSTLQLAEMLLQQLGSSTTGADPLSALIAHLKTVMWEVVSQTMMLQHGLLGKQMHATNFI